MMLRSEMIKLILKDKNKEFQSEIGHYMSIDDREYAYDEVSALFDLHNAAEDFHDRDMLRVTQRLLIEIGFFRVMTQEEIDSTIRSDGRKPWDFKHMKIAYTSDYSADSFGMFPPEKEVA